MSRLTFSLLVVVLISACSSEDADNQSAGTQPEVGELASSEATSTGPGDLSGRVSSANGPEAGVWVIAETEDLGTAYAKIVVTNDNGEYLLPDLPDANYQLWVRGYGLIDSAKVLATP